MLRPLPTCFAHFVSCRSASRFNSPSVIWRSIPFERISRQRDTAQAETTGTYHFRRIARTHCASGGTPPSQHPPSDQMDRLRFPKMSARKLSQVRRPACFTRPAAVHALAADLPDLLLSHRANLCNPELRRCGPVLPGPAVRINLPMIHSFQAVSVADKSVFTFPLLTCCPNFLNCP